MFTLWRQTTTSVNFYSIKYPLFNQISVCLSACLSPLALTIEYQFYWPAFKNWYNCQVSAGLPCPFKLGQVIPQPTGSLCVQTAEVLMSLSPGCSCHLDPLALENTADNPESENRIPELLSSLLQGQIQAASTCEITFSSSSGHSTSTKQTLAL